MRVPHDYAEFVRERQSDLLRAAYLVSGHPDAGRALLLEALVDLARHWHQVRGERPDAYLRRGIYERALAAGPGHADEVVAAKVTAQDEVGADLWRGDLAARRHDLMRSLAELTPVQRAVLVDRYLECRCEDETDEVLGLAPPQERVALTEALRHLSRLVPVPAGAGAGDAGDQADELWALLELGADDVVDEDLVDAAWAEATARRHRVARRAVLGALGAGAVGLGASLVADRLGTAEVRGRPTTGPELATTTVGGAHLVLAPRPGDEPSLVTYPGAAALGLGEPLGSRDTARTSWTDTPVDVPLHAVLIAKGAAGFEVVLDLPVAQPRRHRAVTVGLEEQVDAKRPLSNRTISRDRRRVVLPCWEGVLVIDASAPSVTRYAIPDVAVRRAGWAQDDRTVVASSVDSGWLVLPPSGTVRAVPLPVCPDREDLGAPGERLEVLTFSNTGVLTGSRRVHGPWMTPSGESCSATDDEGWVAGEVFLGAECQEATGRRNGLVAVPPGDPAVAVVLATSPEPGDMHRFAALRWVASSTLLLESRSNGGDGWVARILAWDVRRNLLWRVSEVEPSSTTSWFTGFYAI